VNRCFVQIVELASCVGRARCQYDVARRGQPLEAGIAVDLQHTTEVLEMTGRTLCLAISEFVVQNVAK
jgi:hypothetical protein